MNNSNGFRTLAARLLATALFLTNTASALADVHYVDVNSTNATPPYLSWATAAMNIQNAVDAAVAGDEIVVTNGIYTTGGRNGNRVTVDKPLSIHSINGPQFTAIMGTIRRYNSPKTRCVYLTDGASLSGFTLTGGVAHLGGGVLCGSPTAVVSNCVVSDNSAHEVVAGYSMGIPPVPIYSGGAGGGVYGGTLNNCTLSRNSATGVNASGGGASYTTLNNCTLSGNSYGGAANGSTLNNCTLTGNSYGAYFSALNNCTLTDNGIGAYFSTLNNCIAYFNVGQNYDSSSTLNYSCTSPQPDNGFGNITNAPLFVDAASSNLRLQPDSACNNAGNNDLVQTTTDSDGNPRIADGIVDIGAYELPITPAIALGRLLLFVNDAHLEGRNKQPLLADLRAALSSVERGNLAAALNQLSAFQNKVRAQIARSHPSMANEVTATSQRISDVLSGR
jgi:hypothetical protein